MRVAMRHDGRPGAVESIEDRRVALCTGHCLIAPLLFLFLPRFPCQEADASSRRCASAALAPNPPDYVIIL